LMCIVFQSCDLNFSTCFKVCSVQGTEVLLRTRSNFFFWGGGMTGILIDYIIEFNGHSTQKYR
jgi:hypothetical protein